MALLRALADSEYFDVVALAPRRELFIPLCAPLYPDMIIVDDAAAGGDAESLADMIAGGRRIVPVVVSSGRGISVVNSDVTMLTVKQLHRTDTATRNDVQTALFAAATPIFTSKRTLLGDELEQHAALLKDKAKRDNIRNEVMSVVSWPLDLILLVDDGSNVTRIGKTLKNLKDLPVPVVLVLETNEDGYGELEGVAPKLTKRMVEPTSVRRMGGLYVVPRNRRVQIWNENVYVAPGERDAEALLTSMAWLKSGGLSIVLSSANERHAETLGQVAAHGGLIAVLDPAFCENPEAGRATNEWQPPALMLAPDELRWVLSYALPRKG